MKQVIFNTHDVVLLMTAYQCILFAILLLTIKQHRPLSNFFLAFFLLQQAAIPLDILISFGEAFRQVALEWSPNLFYVFGFGYWLEGPFLLWYTRSLVYKNYQFTRKDLLYLLPFFAYLIYQIFFYYSLNFGDKKHLQESYNLLLAPQYMIYVTLFRELFRVALGILCLREIKRYSNHITTNYSDIEHIELTWLKLLVIGFLSLRIWAVFVIMLVFMSVIFGIKTRFGIMGLAANYSTLVLISLLIFFSLRHHSHYQGLDEHTLEKDEAAKDKVIAPEQIEQIDHFMKTQKPYLTPALTLEKLAALMSMQPRLLSYIINRHYDCNFFDFVNSYRVEEAKKRLAENASHEKNILDLMFDVGFNSKATFNTLFKKKVGMTPTEYKKSILQEAAKA